MVAFANAAGALTTMKKGVIPALPTVEEFLNLMKHIAHKDKGEI
jgi:sugar/nucleoside kinase (ribokinase family)